MNVAIGLFAATTLMQGVLSPYVERGELPGAISILRNGDREEVSCIGYADFEAKRPIALTNVFMQCSQTKGFCGVTVAKLVEEGRLGLDDPVSKYLPEFSVAWVRKSETNGVRTLIAATNAITVRMVMNHTSGLPFELPAHAVCGWNHRMPLRNAAAEAAATPLLFQPGTAVKYSNIGIDVGAAVVQKIVGKPWEEYLKQEVLDPLGMKDTTFWPSDVRLADKIEGYNTKEGGPPHHNTQFGPMPLPYNGPGVFPSAGAGLWTTAEDQVKFFGMLMNLGVGENGIRILKEETVRKLLGKSSRPEGMPQYSLGFWCSGDGWIGHGGAWGNEMQLNFNTKQLDIWIVQLGCGPRPWEKTRIETRNNFFSTTRDPAASDYTGRVN